MRFALFIAATFCISFSCISQDVFKGIVADSATFSPLPSVTVRIKNQNKGTTTDMYGNFSITATGRDTLVLSLVGYNTLEVPLLGWEPSMLLMSEKVTLLKTLTIRDTRIENPYEGMFDEQNENLRKLHKSIPFYYSKARKQKIRVGRLQNENLRVQTYVDVVIKNTEVKDNLIKKHSLTEDEYYKILGDFNAKNYSIMYYLTAGELISLLNNFFTQHTK